MSKVENDILTDDNVSAAKQVDLKAYLQERGFEFNRQNFCSSPFTRDSNWSFKYYPSTNSFFDWSKGFGGDTIKLVMLLDNVGFADAIRVLLNKEWKPFRPNYKESAKVIQEVFQVDKYINDNKRECAAIDEYARSRSIKRGYEHGIFFTKDEANNWVRNPAVMFVLRDKQLKPCGVKFRKIYQSKTKDGSNGDRFSSRGSQGFYILENILAGSYEDPVLFLIESESSANSLWEYCCDIGKSAVIISFGSVGSQFDELPIPYQNLKDKRLIIDYDGNEELYLQRLDNFKHLDAKPLKLILEKGEDINSLYTSNQMFKISNILFNG